MISPAIQFVYFDLGNVLVHFDHRIAAKNLSILAGSTVEKATEVLFTSGLEERYELGQIDSGEFVRQICDGFHQELEASRVLRAVSDMFCLNHSMLEVLQYVKCRRIPMGLLSNTCEAHWNWILARRYPTVEGWFRHHVLSFEVRSMKPSPAIYEFASKMAAVNPQAIYFTDDKIDNIHAALAAGWQAEPFTSASDLMHRLTSSCR